MVSSWGRRRNCPRATSRAALRISVRISGCRGLEPRDEVVVALVTIRPHPLAGDGPDYRARLGLVVLREPRAHHALHRQVAPGGERAAVQDALGVEPLDHAVLLGAADVHERRIVVEAAALRVEQELVV